MQGPYLSLNCHHDDALECLGRLCFEPLITAYKFVFPNYSRDHSHAALILMVPYLLEINDGLKLARIPGLESQQGFQSGIIFD